MISTLKKRPPVTEMPVQKHRQFRWGRRIYGFLLLVFAAALLNYLLGSFFFLRADGLVLQQQYSIGPSFESTIKTLHAQPGQYVSKGSPLVSLESATLSRTFAELSARQAELTSRMAQIKSKLLVNDTLLPYAKSQFTELQKSFKSVQELKQKQLVNSQRSDEVQKVSFTAREKLIELEAQSVGLAAELKLIERAHDEAEASVVNLRRIYGDGQMTAPVDGIVGSSVASTGEVVMPGTRIMEIFAGAPYILAYLPDTYFFSLTPQQNVQVSSGWRTSTAMVELVLPVAGTLPPEFQNTFRPRDRTRLVRVTLPAGHGFTVLQKVRISQCYLADCQSEIPFLIQSARDIANQLKDRLRPLLGYGIDMAFDADSLVNTVLWTESKMAAVPSVSDGGTNVTARLDSETHCRPAQGYRYAKN